MTIVAQVGLTAASAVVLAIVVPWGDFQGHMHWTKVAWIPFVSPPVRLRDIIHNLILCAPVGAFAALLFRRPLLSAFGITLLLSVTGEWLQIYSHSRFPSATDVTCNLAGALGGAAIVRRLAGRS